MTRYLITSALPYINGVKHLGNLVGSLLPADVYARYLRQQGHAVLFVSGTDEHGTPTELAAAKAGIPVADFCDQIYRKQADIYEQFAISLDWFGRSSSDRNHRLTQEIFHKLNSNGFIEERIVAQVYSVDEDRFLPDRYIIGTCPHCGFSKARGDQCDGCGQLLDAVDLLEPHSAIAPESHLEIRESKHLFLLLSKLQPQVETWVSSVSETWPAVSRGIAHKWLREGLHDRCITRDIHWGVAVPHPGYTEKVFYVWFDAPNAYIAFTQEWASAHGRDWTEWWTPDEDLKYVQFLAKDNVPFHAIFWPAALLGTGEPWKLVDIIKGFSWLTYDGGKFSTSQGRGIFTDTALQLYPADYWRYYLLSAIPESSDSDFTFELFSHAVNKDLADVLGNFINRFATLVHRDWAGTLPDVKPDDGFEVFSKCRDIIAEYQKCIEDLSFRAALHSLRKLWCLGNEYFTDREPWKLSKTDEQGAAAVLATGHYLVRLIAAASSPIVPTIAAQIYEFLGYDDDPACIPLSAALEYCPPHQQARLKASFPLFEKISEETIDDLKRRFA